MTAGTTSKMTKTFNYDTFDRMTSVVQGQTTLQSITYGPDRCPRHSDSCSHQCQNGRLT